MKRAAFILATSLMLLLTGCVLRAKPQTKSNNVPPPPKPTAAATSATPPPGPLSIRQTQVDLPAPQPITPEALATTIPPEVPPEDQRPPRVPRRAPVAGPPKPEQAPVQTQTPTPAAAAPPAAEPERPPIQEILPAAELKKLQESADARKRDIRRVLEQVGSQRLNGTQREKVERIRSFLKASDEAESHNDMRQAEQLAEKAQTLVGELQSGR